MKRMFIGKEVEVYQNNERESRRGEVVRLDCYDSGQLSLVLVRASEGSKVWFDAVTGCARGTWRLAPKHLPAVAAK